MIFGFIKNKLYMRKQRRKWRKKNEHNSTTLCNNFDQSCVTVGKASYGPLTVLTERTDVHLKIGNYCSIAPEVLFVLSSEHYTENISTFPFKVKICGEKHEAISKGDIIIDDDVWIGARATVLSGVHIGQGAIVAAGAVVTKDIPPYAIAGGVPAKIIKYRFSDDVIEELLKIDYSKLDKDFVEKNIDFLYTKIDDETDLSRLPKKGEIK